MKIVLMEKQSDGQLVQIQERPWDASFIQALDAANYVLLGGKEYEMIEGRLNLDTECFELLLLDVELAGEGEEGSGD
ncbi:hypothetical protein [Paenibacillus athensensis]|nr:hypothetical protein [Paenibacillus athensensis]